MGVFDSVCAASGIVLDGWTRLLLVIEDARGVVPCLPPLQGRSDRYGKIENILPGPARVAAEKLAQKLELDDLDELFDAAFDGGVPVAKGTLRYMLIDELVYRAMVSTVASGGVPGLTPNLEAELSALEFGKLLATALGDPEFALPLLESFEKDEGLRHELVELAVFRKMPIALVATSVDSPSGQYLFFHESVAAEQGLEGEAVETLTRAAEKAFASYPLVLAAVAENERVWIDREKTNLDGDQDEAADEDEDDEEEKDDDEEQSSYTVSLQAPKGHAIPPLLADFGAWLQKRKYGAVGYFELVTAPIRDWDPTLATRLRDVMEIMHLPEGSSVVLVKNENHPPPVALLGSEGDIRTLAGSLEEFLLNLAEGSTGIMELDDEEAGERKALADFLKAKKVRAPDAPDFDFDAWLGGIPQAEARPATAPPPVKTELVADLPPFFRRLASMMGRRADDPELVAFVHEVLGKNVPGSIGDRLESLHVSAKSKGVELAFHHDVLNDAYPLVPKSERSYVPYLCYAWLTKRLPDGLPFGLQFGDGKRGTPWGGVKTIDAARDIVLDLQIFKPGVSAVLRVAHAREIVGSHGVQPQKVVLGVFLAWAIRRNLLDRSRFPAHQALIDAIEKREKQGSALLVALARGFWDDHLRDLEGLRLFAYQNFGKAEGDLISQFGKRKDSEGEHYPKLDDDTWEAVDEVTPKLDKRFARWIER